MSPVSQGCVLSEMGPVQAHVTSAQRLICTVMLLSNTRLHTSSVDIFLTIDQLPVWRLGH